MPRAKRRDSKTRMTTRIAGRCTPDEKRDIAQRAEAAGITTSRFLIHAALGRAIRPVTDLKVINELRKLGGLIRHDHNQIEGHARPYSLERAELMNELRRAIQRIGRDIHVEDQSDEER
jgi:hypothetical protein